MRTFNLLRHVPNPWPLLGLLAFVTLAILGLLWVASLAVEVVTLWE